MELAYMIGALCLALGLAYGAVSYLSRDRRQDQRTEQATKALYENPPPDKEP